MGRQIKQTVSKNFKQAVRKNKKLYVLSRTLKELSTEQLYKLIWGFYESVPDYSSVIIEHPGELNPDEVVDYISLGEKLPTGGFFAVMRGLLAFLYYADSHGFTPVVMWGRYTPYYEPGMDKTTKNVFEYYYKPSSHISSEDALQCKNLIYAAESQWKKLEYDLGINNLSYDISEKELESLAEVYKKYCRLNQTTKEYIEKELKTIINGKKTLGVHVRGTDFRYQVIGHPVIVTADEFLNETKKLLYTGRYERVFLATDDNEALELFKKEIPSEMLVYYHDVQRGSGFVAPFEVDNSRYLNKYILGLEVLRDVYTLACCDGLVGGLSQVGFAARYINIAIGRTRLNDCIIIDRGILEKNSSDAKKRRKRLLKESKPLRKAARKNR